MLPLLYKERVSCKCYGNLCQVCSLTEKTSFQFYEKQPIENPKCVMHLIECKSFFRNCPDKYKSAY